MGLHEAALAYPSERGVAFTTVLGNYLRKEMRAAIGIRSSKRDASIYAASLDVAIGDDTDTTQGDLLQAKEDTEDNAVERGYSEYIRAVIQQAVANIKSQSERETIEAVYFEGKTAIQIATERGVSRSWVHALLHDAYKSLRRNPQIQALVSDYYCCEIYYTHTGPASFQNSRISPVEASVLRLERSKKQNQEKTLVDMLNNLVPGCMIDLE